MPDNLQYRGGQDRTRIDVHQDYELRDWARKFGVTREQLEEAVQAVGNSADAVERHLRERRSTSSGSEGRGGDRPTSGTSERR